MAPEYLNTGTLTPESDIFSLGVIVLEVVTGRRDYPFVDNKTSSDDFIELVRRFCLAFQNEGPFFIDTILYFMFCTLTF